MYFTLFTSRSLFIIIFYCIFGIYSYLMNVYLFLDFKVQLNSFRIELSFEWEAEKLMVYINVTYIYIVL